MFCDDLYPLCSSHAKPIVLADRRRAQTDPAGRLEKCGLELSLKVGHLALENSVTMLYHIPVFKQCLCSNMVTSVIIAPGQRRSTESSIIESIMCIIKFCLSDFIYLNSLVPRPSLLPLRAWVHGV